MNLQLRNFSSQGIMLLNQEYLQAEFSEIHGGRKPTDSSSDNGYMGHGQDVDKG